MQHWVVFADDTTTAVEADHFAFGSAHLTLTRWTWVLLGAREVVVRRLPIGGTRPIVGVMTDDMLPASIG